MPQGGAYFRQMKTRAIPAPDLTTGAGLIACPSCDALHLERDLQPGERVHCARCGIVLANPQKGAFTWVIALSVTAMVLMIGAIFFPFLEISRMGFGNETSLFGVAMAFSHGILLPLTIVVMILIVGLPLTRAGLLIYTLWPLSMNRGPYRHAARAFRLSEMMRPWSMAEIFVIGTTVALIKIAGLANVSLGPAFWAFCAMILATALSDRSTSSVTIWDAIEDGTPNADLTESQPT